MDIDRAATISLRVLAFLIEDRTRLQRFLNLTGIAPETLAVMAPETNFQASVLEYLLGDEPLLLEFCGKEEINPSQPAKALRVLTVEMKEPRC